MQASPKRKRCSGWPNPPPSKPTSPSTALDGTSQRMAQGAQILPADVRRSDALESSQSALDEAHAFYAAAQLTARRSNLISVASLLFSACAVALSLTLGGGSPSGAAPAQRLVAERAAPKALNPDAHYVRLEELSIYRDQIVAGAIGTAELGDASVSWPGGAPHGAAVSARPLLPTAFSMHTHPCARSAVSRCAPKLTRPCLRPR